MCRLVLGAWLVVLVACAGCKSAGRVDTVERAGKREQELHAVNSGLDARQQVVPRLAREQFDPLILAPQQGPRPTQ